MSRNVYPHQGAETRLVRETQYGVTPVSPKFIRVNGFGITLTPKVDKEPFAPPGAMVPTAAQTNDDYTEAPVEGSVDFNGLPVVLSSLFGYPLIEDLGGNPKAYRWTWVWNGRRPNRPVSFTVHNGFPDSADVATGYVFNTLEINGGRADGFDVSGDGFGKSLQAGQALGGLTAEVQTITKTGTVSGGDYTITIVQTGETTGDIAYDANAAAIQAAIDALPRVGAGNIVVTGGPISTTPATLTYSGPEFVGENVAQATVDSSSLTGGGTYGVTTTTPGADEVYDIPPVLAGAVDGNVYLDSTWAGLGSGQLLYCYEMGVSIGDRMNRVRPINKSKSSDTTIDVSDQEHMITLMLGRNAVADAQLAKLRNGALSFVRTEWVGEPISGGNDYLAQFDSCVFYQEVGDPEDVEGVYAREYSGRLAIDPVSKNVIRVVIVNTLASLDAPAP